MPKTRPYCYWLKKYDQSMCFRIEMDSEAYVLWNHYFLKNRKKKNRIKSTIGQIIKMARERIGHKGHIAVFLFTMKNECGSGQKAFDRIFKLALERYQELYHLGQAPRLIPMKFVDSRTESIPRTEKIPRRTVNPLEKIKVLFSDDLRNVLTFQIKDRKAILKTKFYLANGRWERIMEIVKKHGGIWVSKDKESHWVIPLE